MNAESAPSGAAGSAMGVGISAAPSIGASIGVESLSSFGPTMVGDLGPAPMADFHAPDLNPTATAMEGFARMDGDIAAEKSTEVSVLSPLETTAYVGRYGFTMPVEQIAEQVATSSDIPESLPDNPEVQTALTGVIENKAQEVLDMPHSDEDSRAKVLQLADEADLTDLPAVQEIQEQQEQEEIGQEEVNEKVEEKTDGSEKDEKSEEKVKPEEDSQNQEELERQKRAEEEKRKQREEDEKKKRIPQPEPPGPVVDVRANQRRVVIIAESAAQELQKSSNGEVSGSAVAAQFTQKARQDDAAISGIVQMMGGRSDNTIELVGDSLKGKTYDSVQEAVEDGVTAVNKDTAVTIGQENRVSDEAVAKVFRGRRYASLAPARI